MRERTRQKLLADIYGPGWVRVTNADVVEWIEAKTGWTYVPFMDRQLDSYRKIVQSLRDKEYFKCIPRHVAEQAGAWDFAFPMKSNGVAARWPVRLNRLTERDYLGIPIRVDLPGFIS